MKSLFDGYTIDLIKHIYKNGFTTFRSQNIYKSFLGFYFQIKYLKEQNIITNNGKDERNRKIWVLTDKGIKIAKLLNKIEEVLNESKSNIS